MNKASCPNSRSQMGVWQTKHIHRLWFISAWGKSTNVGCLAPSKHNDLSGVVGFAAGNPLTDIQYVPGQILARES